jgi:hypothetical protein
MKAAAILLFAAAASGCRTSTRSMAAEQAYGRGQADELKRLYWAKQALEKDRAGVPSGRIEYFSWQDRAPASDGRRLAPEQVAVPVFVPSPLP